MQLIRHPSGPCPGVSMIEAEAFRAPEARLELRYRIACAPGAVALPPKAPPLRADGLWRRTCLEAFLKRPGTDAYYELNLSPSTEWAAYGFTGYRTGITPALQTSPEIAFSADEEGFELRAAVDLSALTGLSAQAPWRIGLAAVIEEAVGRVSYWALAHPPGKPDFHSPDGFVLELRP